MTSEQITLFEDFLKRNGYYNAFYECLTNAPIELAYKSRTTYLPRVNPLLVLSYGFFQNRNLCGMKDKDWRNLRDSWINIAAEANILGKAFVGIKPRNIISAVNSVFNGKQYSGSTFSSNTYSAKIAEEAQKIQDTKDAQMSENEIAPYRKLLATPAMGSPELVFPEKPNQQTLNEYQIQARSSEAFVSKRKELLKSLTETKNSVERYLISDAQKSMIDVVDQFSALRTIFDESYDSLVSKYSTERLNYIERYNQRQKDIAEAKEIIAKYEARQKTEAEAKAAPVHHAKAATKQAANDEFKAIDLSETKVLRRLDKNEISVPSFQRSKTNFNSFLSGVLTKGGYLYYTVGVISGSIHIRFSKYGVNQLISNGKDSLSIGTRKVGDYLLSSFGISDSGAFFKISAPEQIDEDTIDVEVLSATPNVK